MTSLEEILTQVSIETQVATAFYMTGKITQAEKDRTISRSIEKAFEELNNNDLEMQQQAEML